jgi:hypothetical protein
VAPLLGVCLTIFKLKKEKKKKKKGKSVLSSFHTIAITTDPQLRRER